MRDVKMSMRTVLAAAVLILALGGTAGADGREPSTPPRGTLRYEEWLRHQVRHELLTLPWYSVFDNLEYSVSGYRVTLRGQVIHPTLRPYAEAAVKRIEGVEGVDNRIELLPASPNDDRIRRAEFRAIYSQPMLQRYSIQAVPPIHIIVKNGHVTLAGAVATEAEKNVANIQANTVPGVFSVKNQLTVETNK